MHSSWTNRISRRIILGPAGRKPRDAIRETMIPEFDEWRGLSGNIADEASRRVALNIRFDNREYVSKGEVRLRSVRGCLEGYSSAAREGRIGAHRVAMQRERKRERYEKLRRDSEIKQRTSRPASSRYRQSGRMPWRLLKILLCAQFQVSLMQIHFPRLNEYLC